MLLEVHILFHVYILVRPELASAFCECTTVPVLAIDLEVACGVNL